MVEVIKKKRGRPSKKVASVKVISETIDDGLDIVAALEVKREEKKKEAKTIELDSNKIRYVEILEGLKPQLSDFQYEMDAKTNCLALKGGLLIEQCINLSSSKSEVLKFIGKYTRQSYGNAPANELNLGY